MRILAAIGALAIIVGIGAALFRGTALIFRQLGLLLGLDALFLRRGFDSLVLDGVRRIGAVGVHDLRCRRASFGLIGVERRSRVA